MSAFDLLRYNSKGIPGKAIKRPAPSDVSGVGSTSKKKYESTRKERQFQESWLKNRGWLLYDKEANIMKCNVCVEYNSSCTGSSNLKNANKFITGSNNFKLSTVTDHADSPSHQNAASKMKARSSSLEEINHSKAGKALQLLNSSQRHRLAYLFRGAHAVAKTNKSLSDYNWVSADHKRSRYGERKRTRYDYKFQGGIICRKSFMIIYDIKESSLKSLIKHVNEIGNVPRVHGNKGRKPSNALLFPDIEKAVKFIASYGNDFGIPQPAAPRGRDNIAPIFLPASSTKKCIHQTYMDACTGRMMGYKTFCKVWNHCSSHIKIAKPEDDVCAKCELLRRNVADARTEADKLQTATQLQQHIISARMEHQVYRSCIDKSRSEFRDVRRPQEPIPPLSTDYQHAHYTFDFSQSVCVPHHSRQMGPLYFLTARKVHIFGFRDDGIPCQYNYVVDEAVTMDFDGKGIHGPNAVISMIHHALGNFSHGEKSTTLHADNCGGQNKNKYVLAYFAWRTMTGENTNIKYLMQLPGHARCLVDAGFAHIKRLYRRSDSETVEDIERLVNLSAKTNKAVRYRAGNTFEWRDWKAFLNPIIKPVKGIRQYQQFEFSSDNPGHISMKSSNDSDVVVHKLIKSYYISS